MKNNKFNLFRIATFGQENNKIIIDENTQRISLSERRSQNSRFIDTYEQQNKKIHQQSEKELIQYYVSPKKLKVKHIYKEVEKEINLKKDIILPQLKLGKIKIQPPELETSMSPTLKRKKQYHYFLKSPFSNSFNIKDLNTRSFNQNKSSFLNEKLDITAPIQEINKGQDEKKKSIYSDILKSSNEKNNQKIMSKRAAQDKDTESDGYLDTAPDENMSDSKGKNSKRKIIKEVKEDKEEDRARYNMTFRGSVKKSSSQLQEIRQKISQIDGESESDKSQEEDSSNSSSENEDKVEEVQKEIKNNTSVKGLKDYKVQILSQRLSMQPYVNPIPNNPLMPSINITMQNNKKKSIELQKSAFALQNRLQRQSSQINTTLKGYPPKKNINQLLQRLKTQIVNSQSVTNLTDIHNEQSVDENSSNKLKEKIKSVSGLQLDDILKKDQQPNIESQQNDENMIKLKKKQKAVQALLKKNHQKLFDMSVQIKKSNKLEDEYKDIHLFQKNIGYSLPIVHKLKYFDSNSGMYQYLHGRSSIKEQVVPEQNEYYQLLNMSGMLQSNNEEENGQQDNK